MLRELSNSLLRVALKQVTEEQLRKENENLGMLLSVVHAVSEKADTRNWQTLPYSISYARVPLKAGDNSIQLKTYSFDQEETEQQFDFTAHEGESIFHIFHSLESVR